MNLDLQTHIKQLIQSKQIAYLSFDAVERNGVFDFGTLLPLIDQAYRAHYRNEVVMPHSEYLKYPGRPSYDRIIPLLGHLGGPINVSGIKEICSSTRNAPLGFPRASGLLTLNDPETQRPFAVLEASQISAARTAAVTGLAIQKFAPKTLKRVAWLGAGYLAETHAVMWSQLYRERSSTIHFFDPSADRMETFARKLGELGLTAKPMGSPEEAIRGADCIIPLTTSETPYIKAEWIEPQALYSAVSLLDPELDVLRQAKVVVVDDLGLSTQEGRPLQRLQQSGELERLKLYSMGQVLSEELPVSTETSGMVFFNPMGTVITDLAVAAAVFCQAVENQDCQRLDV